MGTTEPIRKKESLKKFMEYYQNIKPRPRDYALTIVGLHTALRISDILNLQWKDLYDFKKNCFFNHLLLFEKKTKKKTIIAVNASVKEALERHRKTCQAKPNDYVFSRRTNCQVPLCRSSAYRIIKKSANATLGDRHISCHSLRKTFGYHAYKQGISPVLLMDLFNHSSFDVTKRYLGISQEERDSIFLSIDL